MANVIDLEKKCHLFQRNVCQFLLVHLKCLESIIVSQCFHIIVHVDLRQTCGKSMSGLGKKLALRNAKQAHKESIKIGYQCGFRVGHLTLDLLLHGACWQPRCSLSQLSSHMFKGTRLEYVPQLGQAMKDWIMDNVRLGLSIAQIMVKHEWHCFDEDPTK
jgi:hypothetical protein